MSDTIATEPVAVVAPDGVIAPEPVVTEPASQPTVAEPAPHTETPTLLTQTEPATPEPATPAVEPAPAESVAPPEPVAPEPLSYEAPTLPDGMVVDTERLAALDGVIGQHRLPADARQQLVDMYVAERSAWEQAALRGQHDAFGKVRADWRAQIAADEEIGGAASETVRSSAMRTIDQFVSPKHRDEWENMLVTTGAGDHPAMLRFLRNVATKFDAPAIPLAPNNPPPDRGLGRGGQRRLRDYYDNPRSNRA